MRGKNKQRYREKICFYCRKPGHQISSCLKKETDEATQLIRQAVNTGIQNKEEGVKDHQEMIVVGTEGGIWSDIWYVNNTVNEKSGLTREEEIGLKEKQNIIEEGVFDEEFKQRYLNSYFEELNLSSQEIDWSIMIVMAMEFNEFEDCRAFMNLLDDREFVFKYKHILDSKFEELVKWFLFEYMGILTRPVPPVTSHKRKINLLSLYLLVAVDGGYKNVTTENLWPAIAKDLGFDYEDGDYMRVTYAMYLGILEYYYNFKAVQKRVQDKETVLEEGRSTGGCHERSKSAGEAQQESAGAAQVALFAGIDDEDWNQGKRRKRFNFNYARWAVDEANRSVLDQARKHNQV
ncbi:putative transcription factor interactor and regulator CCHC(Zn) family [Helianthus annuus]|nr:putative transcription factor interactor and regulator CCHC(Zn) family [Helianthus annuus]